MEDQKKETILFVDDEESIRDVASRYFERQGYQALTACNGVEALKVFENERVDCCFTDINMPEMNGLELAENIRMRDATMPVIVMTGYPSLENTIQTLKNGVVDFLIKPVNLRQMELCMLRVMQQRGLFVENVILKEEVKSKERLEKLNRELLYKVDELNILNKIMGSFTNTGSTTDVFKRAVDVALEITYADHCMFHVINESVGQPFEVAFAGKGGDEKDKNELESAPEPAPNVVGEPPSGSPSFLSRVIMEVASDEIPLLISENNSSCGLPKEMLSVMIVPLKIRQKVFGALTAIICQSEIRFSEKDLYYLSFMAQSAAQS
ncbi:MAG: response regulator, partial [Desulfobacterales bacterium]